MTDMPVPCQSSNSSRACSRTSCGRTAGPGLKLKTLPTFFFRSMDWNSLQTASTRFVPTGILFQRPVGGLDPVRISVGIGGSFSFWSQVLIRAHVVVLVHDFLQAGELLFRTEIDQRHALGGTAHFADFLDPGTDQHAAGGNEHDFVAFLDQRGRD